MHARSRALALLIVFAFGLGPLAPAVFAEEKAPELENLKKQMLQMEEQFRQLQRQIEKLETKKIQEVEAKANAALEASKKTFASQFNPAISLGIDTIGSYKSNRQSFNPGDGTAGTPHAGQTIKNNRPGAAGFKLPHAYWLNSADVQPFPRAYTSHKT